MADFLALWLTWMGATGSGVSVTHHLRHPSQPSNCVPISGPACHLALHCIPGSRGPGSVGRGLEFHLGGCSASPMQPSLPCGFRNCMDRWRWLQACQVQLLSDTIHDVASRRTFHPLARRHDYVITPGRSKMTTPASQSMPTRGISSSRERKKDISPGGSRVRRNVPA